MSRPTNRLIHEASPYLLAHAHNPVDWYPWGAEALARAKSEDRPILLSIGYSACHFCHAMERESFDNEAIARKMNDHFVCIKVDREERPDLDHVYQLALQLMGGSGGWPLTVFLTPDHRPFFAGTYFPPEDRHGIPGLSRVLDVVAEKYALARGEIELEAKELSDAIARLCEAPHAGPYVLGPDLLAKAAALLSAKFDNRHGGFGSRPKFPEATALEVLLRRAALEHDEQAAVEVRLALDAMRAGGIWDHLAGGFHRYAVDERWLVPHFEKMLYDNALLLGLYCDGLRVFGDDRYAETASDIGTYLLREMQSEEGGFFSSQDADSDGEEGRYFVWTADDIRTLFSDDRTTADVVRLYFGVTEEGNFGAARATVLSESLPAAAVAEKLGRPIEDIDRALQNALPKMLGEREKRTRPARDEKILAGWNGLAIAALADASAALREPALLAAAEKAFGHLERVLIKRGRVERLVKGGVVKGPGFLDDHAFVCVAALTLYEVTGDPARLATAAAIADEILDRFRGADDGAFFLCANDAEPTIVRVRDPFDQAVPSGTSMAALALLKLGALLNERYATAAAKHLEPLAAAAVDNPFAFGRTIAALDRLVRGPTDVVIIGAREHPLTRALADAVFSAYLPNRNVVLADPDEPTTLRAANLLTDGKPHDGGPVAYVCHRGTCSPPLHDADTLSRALAQG
jgi:hypothetical protein